MTFIRLPRVHTVTWRCPRCDDEVDESFTVSQEYQRNRSLALPMSEISRSGTVGCRECGNFFQRKNAILLVVDQKYYRPERKSLTRVALNERRIHIHELKKAVEKDFEDRREAARNGKVFVSNTLTTRWSMRKIENLLIPDFYTKNFQEWFSRFG